MKYSLSDKSKCRIRNEKINTVEDLNHHKNVMLLNIPLSATIVKNVLSLK